MLNSLEFSPEFVLLSAAALASTATSVSFLNTSGQPLPQPPSVDDIASRVLQSLLQLATLLNTSSPHAPSSAPLPGSSRSGPSEFFYLHSYHVCRSKVEADAGSEPGGALEQPSSPQDTVY